MADLAAPLLRRIRPAVPDAVLLAPDPTGIHAQRRRNGRTEPLGTIPWGAPQAALHQLLGRKRDPLVVQLSSPLLIRETTLPAAAQANLDRVLRYEMDRLTPFSADDVLFTHRILGSDRARSSVRVELAFVPQSVIQPVLQQLHASGAVPVALEAPGPDGTIRRIAIARQDPARQARARLASRLALATCAALAAAVVMLPLLRQSLALAEAEDRIAALRPRVDQVEALRKRIATSSAGARRIAEAREQAGTMLQMLAVLTDALPDDTWLTTLSLRQHNIVMEGHSAASAKVIAGMAAEPRLRDTAFAAPVVRGDNGSEVFTIRTGFGP